MTDKELKQMSRKELLELLIIQIEENERLNQQLKNAQEELQSRKIILEEAGSIAEAALVLNGVFQSAQEAAEQYLENVRALNQRQEERCRKIEEEAQEKAQNIIEEAQEYSNRVRYKANSYCRSAVDKVREKMI